MLLIGEEKDVDASRPLLGKPTMCVGRDAELAALESELSACIAEPEARVMLVTAPPGVGQTRLRHEFLRRAARAGELTVLLGRGDLGSAGAPYAILGQAIRRLCGLRGSEPLEEQQRRIAERVSAHIDPAQRERIITFLN